MRRDGTGFNNWNLEKKIRVVVSLAISGTSILVLFIILMTEVILIMNQSSDTIRGQMEATASNYDDTLEQYKSFAIALVINEDIQNYCSGKSGSGDLTEGLNNELWNMLNIQNNLNFTAIVRGEEEGYIYRGRTSITDARFEQAYSNDLENSIPAKGDAAMQISFGNFYHRAGKYTLTLYYPVYSTTNMVNELGMLVMNIDDSFMSGMLQQGVSGEETGMLLTDQSGRIVSGKEEERIGEQVSFADRLEGDSGKFWAFGKLVQYRRIGKWNYYLVNEITLTELIKSSFSVIGLLLVFICLITMSAIWLIGRLIRQFYRPINKVVTTMGAVEEGRLEVRIDSAGMEPDSRRLAEGFNSMMDEINVLMEQVKEEQHQMEQIRFNALQSQIKPHFLYNALECIHWQAVADGNKKISVLVKALAQYYRICLSKGKEVIQLSRELEHVKAYMTIQQMRYGDIISMELDIPEEFQALEIPKMTLQPLVENSIYHGIRVKEGKKGKVVISVKRNGNEAEIYVSDSGTGMSGKAIEEMNRLVSIHDDSFGYGVRNVNKRIELMFGSLYGLRFIENETGGVTVKIRLPINRGAEAPDTKDVESVENTDGM
ncbi:MAG TPA: sensor histidine kinase [Candidatus Mediterraneibacter merdavium]|nr:sensor histidine kinase [Candidatus Mediterraneibacter merdavium]